MSDKKSFEVYLVKKVPFLTKFLGWALVFLFLFVVFIILRYLPSFRHRGYAEMPEYIWHFLILCSCLFLVFLPLYTSLKMKVKGVLVLGEESLSLIFRKMTVEMKADEILGVYLHDPLTRSGTPVKKLNLYFRLYKQVVKRVQLADYSESELLVDKLFKYKNIKFDVFQEKLVPLSFE